MRIVEHKQDCTYKIIPITDYPEYSTLYNPTWEDSGVVTLLYKVGFDNTETLVNCNIQIHVKDNKPQREVYEIPKLSDGWYKLKSYIIPTKDFLLDLGMYDNYNDIDYQEFWKSENPENMLTSNLDMVIAVDENSPTNICFLGRFVNDSLYKTGLFYKWIECTDINDLIEEFINRGIYDGYVYGTNVKVIEENFFNTCTLYNTFINKAQELLDEYKGCSNGFSICNSDNKCKSNINENSILIRDYLWMTLNAIKYAVENEDFISANKLLNCISSCNGIYNNVETNESDCGCS